MTETFQEYSARLLSLSEGKDALAVLSSTPARIGSLIAGLSGRDLAWTPSPSRWSIAQIVTHLADAEIVAAYRIRLILARRTDPGLRSERLGTRARLRGRGRHRVARVVHRASDRTSAAAPLP